MKDQYAERTKQLREDSKERRANARIDEIERKRKYDRLVKELRRTRENKE